MGDPSPITRPGARAAPQPPQDLPPGAAVPLLPACAARGVDRGQPTAPGRGARPAPAGKQTAGPPGAEAGRSNQPQLKVLEPPGLRGRAYALDEEITLGRAAGRQVTAGGRLRQPGPRPGVPAGRPLVRRGPGLHQRHLPEPPAGGRAHGHQARDRLQIGNTVLELTMTARAGAAPALGRRHRRRARRARSTRTSSWPATTSACGRWPTAWAGTGAARSPPRSPRHGGPQLRPAHDRRPGRGHRAGQHRGLPGRRQRPRPDRHGHHHGGPGRGGPRRRRAAGPGQRGRLPATCSGGELDQLTTDYSLVADLVRDGSLSPEEAAVHPQRNILTRVLGVYEDVPVDAFAVSPATATATCCAPTGCSTRSPRTRSPPSCGAWGTRPTPPTSWSAWPARAAAATTSPSSSWTWSTTASRARAASAALAGEPYPVSPWRWAGPRPSPAYADDGPSARGAGRRRRGAVAASPRTATTLRRRGQ